MAEMALALEVGVLAGGTDLAALDNTEPGIKDAAGDWIVGLMSLVGNNFHYRPPKDLLRRSDPELNAYNGHCILIRLSRNIFYDPFLANISKLSITIGMILLKVLLSEFQIAAYEQPAGTRVVECGAGLNCLFCALKMLGVYSPELEKMSLTCGSRYAERKPIKAKELIPLIKEAVKGITDEEHDFKFDVISGDPTGPLTALVADLKPAEACFFIYGRNGHGSHAVVLRRGSDGILELIDPQRGQADIGKEFGFTEARAAELGLEVKPNYYRVRGEEKISAVMIEQSVLFGYWPSKEAVESNIHNFVIGTLMVDNVVGLKMLIDDHKDTSTMMDVEETVVPNPRMDVEMEGGGTETIKYPMTPEKGMSEDDDSTTRVVGKFDTPLFLKKLQLFNQETNTTKADIDPKLFTTILNILGTVEGDNVITHLYEIPEEESEDTVEQEGGAATMITEEEYKTKIKALWSKRTEDYVNDTFELFKEALALYNVGRMRLSTNGRQEGYEVPSTSGRNNQCEVMGDSATGNICWLCDGFAGYKWGNLNPSSMMGICKPEANQPECEHILPAPLMYFLKTLVNNKGGAPTTLFQERLRKKLYDNSCHMCNWKKSETLYIRTREPDGDIEPHIPNILTDVIIFFMVYMVTKSPTCGRGGGNMGTIPADLNRIGSLVHVKGKYFPNPIRAQLDSGFISGRGGMALTRQADAAEVAARFTDPVKLLLEVKKSHDTAYDKLRLEPEIDNIYKKLEKVTNLDSANSLPHIRVALQGTWIPSENLRGELRNIAKVNKNVAVDWILRRFCGIYERMEEICGMLNSAEGKALWKQQLQTVLTASGEPMNSVKTIAMKNNGEESERLRADRRGEPPPAPAPDVKRKREDNSPPSDAPPAVRARVERENSGHSDLAQYDDNELLNVERKPLDESFNYDELLQIPGYTNTQGGGAGGRVSITIRRRSDARTTKKNKKRRTIEVHI